MLNVNHRAFPESCLEIGEIGVILDRCGRFLIIDPNGHAIDVSTCHCCCFGEPYHAGVKVN